MAINKFVSLDVPILDFCMEAGIAHDRYKPNMIRWAKKAYGYMKDCGAAVERKIGVFTFDHCKIELPENITAIEIVAWGDRGCDCDAFMDEIANRCDILPQRVYGSGDVLDGEPTNIMPYEFRVENDVMIFNDDFDGQQVTIRYWQFKTTCEGKLMVNELAVDAIIAYFEFILSKSTRWKNKEFRLTERAIEGMEYRWRRKLAEARGNMIQNTMREEREMANIFRNSDIPSNFIIYPNYALGLY